MLQDHNLLYKEMRGHFDEGWKFITYILLVSFFMILISRYAIPSISLIFGLNNTFKSFVKNVSNSIASSMTFVLFKYFNDFLKFIEWFSPSNIYISHCLIEYIIYDNCMCFIGCIHRIFDIITKS